MSTLTTTSNWKYSCIKYDLEDQNHF